MEKMLSGSPLEFNIRARIADRASELRVEQDDRLAVNIINRLVESLNG